MSVLVRVKEQHTPVKHVCDKLAKNSLCIFCPLVVEGYKRPHSEIEPK